VGVRGQEKAREVVGVRNVCQGYRHDGTIVGRHEFVQKSMLFRACGMSVPWGLVLGGGPCLWSHGGMPVTQAKGGVRCMGAWCGSKGG